MTRKEEIEKKLLNIRQYSFDISTDRWAALIWYHMEKCKAYRITSGGYIWFYEEIN